ncbi:MAG: metallophosphoesterase, partial [Proteobacteria bacterium]|nr:metallophosphoesterase [Pseudomonadota bacterium]
VVVFGDVHGDFDALMRLLRANAIVDAQGRWSGGATHLVSLGDLLDRGPDSRKVMDQLKDLQGQAEAAGGRVHLVLGNHELMNLTGDLRYVAAQEWQAFAADESEAMRATEFPAYAAAHPDLAPDEQRATFDKTYPAGFFAHRHAFSPEGTYGAWLLAQPPLIRINRTLFVHGGLSPAISGYQPDSLALVFADRLRSILAYRALLSEKGLIQPGEDLLGAGSHLSTGDPSAQADPHAEFIELIADPLFLDQGPLWYRGNSLCHPLLEGSQLQQLLSAWQADRVVVGHSPTDTRRVTSRMNGLVIKADTGMLAAYYRGAGYALIMSPGSDQVVDEHGEVSLVREEPAAVNAGGLSDESLATELSQGELSDTAEGLQAGRLRVEFTRLSARKADKAVAAYLLDRHLGLGMVPVTVSRRLNGQTGILTPAVQPWISHTELATRGQSRPNWCSAGHAYELITVFDALIGNRSRTTDNLLTDPRSWRLRLDDHGDAFGTADHTGAYTAPPPVSKPLVHALESLTADSLAVMLNDLLSKREITAILKRRDSILTNWPRV